MTVSATHNHEPFALSLSKGRSWFDRLTTNGDGSGSRFTFHVK